MKKKNWEEKETKTGEKERSSLVISNYSLICYDLKTFIRNEIGLIL